MTLGSKISGFIFIFFMVASFLRMGLLCAKQKHGYLIFPNSTTRQNGDPSFYFQVQKSQRRVDGLTLGQVNFPEPINTCQASVISPEVLIAHLQINYSGQGGGSFTNATPNQNTCLEEGGNDDPEEGSAVQADNMCHRHLLLSDSRACSQTKKTILIWVLSPINAKSLSYGRISLSSYRYIY